MRSMPPGVAGPSPRRWMGLALLTGLVAAVYWLAGMSYSPNWTFQNHYYFAQVAARELAAGRYPLWDPALGAGNLFLEHYGVAPYLLSAPFILLLGADPGVRAFMIGLHLFLAAGAYLAAARLLGHGWPAWIASAAYLFSYRVMFDLNLNSSFSHALLMGLVGWVFWAYEGHRQGGGPHWLLAASGLLAVAIATHPQHAIKLYLFLALWVAVMRWSEFRGRPAAFLGHAAGLLGLPLILVAFKLVEWVTFYPSWEFYSLKMTQTAEAWRTPLTNLFTLPAFTLAYLAQRLTGWAPLTVPYLAAEGSDYLGLSVVLLAVCAWAFRREGPAPPRGLTAMLGVCAVFYYVLALVAFVQRIPGWALFVSVRDRWVFLASFLLAILAGYGARAVAARAEGRGNLWVPTAISVLLLCDLAGISLTMAGMLGTHIPPFRLPLPAEWQRSGLPEPADVRGRVLDLVSGGSNETVAALTPLVVGTPSGTPDLATGLATSNEYFDFYKSLRTDTTTPAGAGGFADRIALLNARTLRIDPTALPSETTARRAVLDGLRGEGGLEPLEAPRGEGFFFRNPRAVECVVPRDTIAIIGENQRAEALFERVARLPGFSVRTLLPVLLPDASRLPTDVAAHLRGALRLDGGPLPAGWIPLSLDGVQRLLADERTPGASAPTCEVGRPSHYAVELRLSPRDRSGFVFLSQAYFEQPGYVNPWVARDEHGSVLPTAKTGAGLTAVWAPAPVRIIRLQFRLPAGKRIAAWVSLGGWAGYLVAVAWTLARRPAGGGPAATGDRL